NASYELSGVSEPERLFGARVSPELFSVLGINPGAGRLLTPDDDREESRVVILSYGLWSRVFGRNPSIIGTSISLDRKPYTVVGVMSQSVEFPPRGGELNVEPADVLVPIAFSQEERGGFGMRYNNTVVARLGPGVSIADARGEMAGLLKTVTEHYPPMI